MSEMLSAYEARMLAKEIRRKAALKNKKGILRTKSHIQVMIFRKRSGLIASTVYVAKQFIPHIFTEIQSEEVVREIQKDDELFVAYQKAHGRTTNGS